MATELKLQDIQNVMIDVAFEAGDMITAASPSAGKPGEKKNSADLVTETDQAVEKMVLARLREHYPEFDFMGEETYEPGDTLSRSTPTFICDPIDGTTNFVHAYPYVSISLGLAFGPRNPLIGVVYNPFTRSLYSAIKGRGAYLNRTIPLPLKGSFASSQDQNSAGSERAVQSHSSVLAAGYRPLEPLTSLSQALLALEWGSDRTGNDFALKASTYAKLCQPREEGGAMVHGIRSFGSAALNMCGVAEGSLDMYWESGCWAWDVCGAWVVLTEAGGRVLDGNPPIEGQESEAWDADAEKDTGVRVDGRRYLCVRKGTDENVIREFWSMLEGRLSYGP